VKSFYFPPFSCVKYPSRVIAVFKPFLALFPHFMQIFWVKQNATLIYGPQRRYEGSKKSSKAKIQMRENRNIFREI